MRLPPGRVNSHHPYRLFTRVITAGLFAPATMWDRSGSGGEDRGGMRLAACIEHRGCITTSGWPRRWPR